MSTGEPEEVEKTYDQWGNEVDQGNRKWGIAINKALPGIVNMIPGYSVVKSINDMINKTSGTTQTPVNLLQTVAQTGDQGILGFDPQALRAGFTDADLDTVANWGY